MLTSNIDFDAFAATLDCPYVSLISFIESRFDLSDSRSCKPRYGYEYAREIYRGDRSLAVVYWGSNSGSVHVRHEGDQSTFLRKILLEYCAHGRYHMEPTRIDSRYDFFEEGLYDDMSKAFIKFAVENNLKISQVGDWERGNERTLYIGSRQSELMVRLYEKGKKEGTDENWIRYEVELKPKKSPQRLVALDYTPEDLLYVKWSGQFLRSIGLNNPEIIEYPSMYKASDDERARLYLVKQYGAVLKKWSDDLGGWDSLAQELEKEICHT